MIWKLNRRARRIRSSKMEEKLEVLLALQKAVTGKLSRVKEALIEHPGVPNLNLKRVNFLKVHLDTVHRCYSEYNGFQNDIYALALPEDQQKQQEARFVEFETLYNELVIELNELLDHVVKPNPSAVGGVQQYLPPLNVPLPTFDGTYESSPERIGR